MVTYLVTTVLETTSANDLKIQSNRTGTGVNKLYRNVTHKMYDFEEPKGSLVNERGKVTGLRSLRVGQGEVISKFIHGKTGRNTTENILTGKKLFSSQI